MTFEERIKEIQEQFDKKIKELKEEFKKKQEENNTWIPKWDEEYYYVTDFGGVGKLLWKHTAFCEEMLEIGNVFKTEKEVEFEIERLKVLAEMKKYSKPFDGKAGNFFIGYRYDSPAIHIYNYSVIQTNEIYFESEEIAQKVIDEVGADRIKKYYLGVK